MAQIHNEHNGQPINEAERLVITALKDELPDDFWVIPWVEIDGMEIDAIVVTPFAVILIEVKGYTGQAVFKEQEHLVNSEPRRPPHIQIEGKARRLASRLRKANRSFQNYWVAGHVVLAWEPSMLHIDPKIKNKICLLAEAPQRFVDRELIIRKNFRWDPVDADKVKIALGVAVKAKNHPKHKSYETLELIDQSPSGRTYRAKHEISGQIVLLQLHEIDHLANPEEKDRQRDSASKAYEVLARLSQGVPTPEISGPIDAFKTDHDDIVVVSREEVGPTLRDLSHQNIALSEDQLLAITRDVSRAIMRAHTADPDSISHRKLSPSFVHTLPSNDIGDCVARVAGWDRADLTQSVMSTMHVTTQEEEHAFWAPEVLNSQVREWQPTDLFALGTLVRWLWRELGDQPVPEELDALCEQMCSSDPDQRLEASSAAQLNEIAKRLLETARGVSENAEVERVANPTKVEDLVPGSVIADRYEVVERLGSGATSGVFAVHDQFSDRDFALKVFRAGIGLETVRHEYAILESLNHPSVVKVKEIFPAEVGLCLKMDLVRGETLRQRLDNSGPIDAELCVPWFLGVLDALDTLHNPEGDAQVVHRDIKPENLIITEDPQRLVLLDFGLASGQGDTPSGGTSRYRPAAQLDPSDPRNDLFALAVVLQEALTGEHPYEGEGPCEGEPSLHDALAPNIAEVIRGFLALREAGLPDGLTEAFEFEAALAAAMNPDAFVDDKKMPAAQAAELVRDLAESDDQETVDAARAQLGLMSYEQLNEYRANEYSTEKDLLNEGALSRASIQGNDIVIESDKFPGWDAVTAMQQVTGRIWNGSVNIFPLSSCHEIIDLAANGVFVEGLEIDSAVEELVAGSGVVVNETPAPNETLIGPKLTLRMSPVLETRSVAETPGGESDALVRVRKATFTALPDVTLDVEFCTLLGGSGVVEEQWVQALDAYNSPREFHRLVHGLRLTSRYAGDEDGVNEEVESFRSIDLRQARIIDDPVWPQIRKVSLDELDSGLGDDTRTLLLRLGASEVGTREEVWHDTSNRRTDLCVTYKTDDVGYPPVPLVAYGICRVAPLVDDAPILEALEGNIEQLGTRIEQLGARIKDLATEPVGLPPLSVSLRIEKGNGWTWASDCGYWACHERQPWRQVSSPFTTFNSALFGPTGARALLHESEKLSGQIKKFGVARAAVIRVKGTAVITDGSSIVAIPWDQIADIDKGDRPGAVLEMIQNHPSPMSLSDYEDGESAVDSSAAKSSRVRQMQALCGEAMPLWDSRFKGYSLEAESLAPELATELNELRNELARDCLTNLQRASELARELRLPESPGAKQGLKRWRSSTWIDFVFDRDIADESIDYDELGNSPRGANLFRVWFTAAGIGIGVRPGLNKSHISFESLLAALPDRYVDLEPNSQGPEEAHPFNLVGVRGRKNHYCATWSSDLQVSDEAFMGRLLSAWEEIGPILSEYRN